MASERAIAQVKVPTLLGASTETERLLDPPLARLPELGAKWHQVWSLDELQELLAVPELLKATLWAAGAGLPETAEKLKAAGLRLRWE